MRSKILIVDENSDALVSELDMHDVSIVRTVAEMSARLEDVIPDLILFEPAFSTGDGFKVARDLGNDIRYRRIPVIFVSSLTDIASLERGFNAGGRDYIKKPYDLGELKLRVANALKIAESERMRMEQALRDELTGVYNRRFLVENGAAQLAHARRMQSTFSLGMLDIDKFKAINDNYGHAIGDSAIRAVAQTISANVRAYDLVCRYGGEEFVVLFPDCKKETAKEILERIFEKLKRVPIVVSGGEGIVVSVSGGVADSREISENATFEDILMKADKRLYRAKSNSRGTACAEGA